MLKIINSFFNTLSNQDLNKHLIKNNFYVLEGHSGQNIKQQDNLNQILVDFDAHNIAEIGFNAGHSALLFLSASKKNKVTSFDLAEHAYSTAAKEFIDKHFYKRHDLIKGDSKESLLNYAAKFPSRKFDLLFIDGGHDFETALTDLINAKKLIKEGGIVVLDDTITNHPEWVMSHNEGPNQAWKEMIISENIEEIDDFDYCQGRGMSVGQYIL